MEILLTIIYTALFSFIILKWRWFNDVQIHKFAFIALFILKVIVGIIACEIYLYKYNGGDSFAFYQSSKVITKSFHSSPGDFIGMVSGLGDDVEFIKQYGKVSGWNNNDLVYNDSRTILRLNALIGLISLGSYYVHIVFFVFLSMLGLTGLFKATRLLTDRNPYLLLAAIFLAPGVLFWLSMPSKESLLIFVLGMFFYHCIRLLTVSKSIGNMAGMFLAGFLFIHIKAYFLLMITPCLLAFTWVIVTRQKFSLMKYSLVYLVGMILIFNASYFLNGFDPLDVLVMKRLNFESFVKSFPEGMNSYINLPYFDSSWGSVLTAAPAAAYTVLARPYIWESTNIFVILSAIENIILSLALLLGLKYVNWSLMVKNKNLMLFCIFFAFSVFVLIGLTTPIMGAMVRYKVPALPFLCLIPVLISGKKIKKPIVGP